MYIPNIFPTAQRKNRMNIGKGIAVVGVWSGISLILWIASSGGYKLNGEILVVSLIAGCFATFFLR